jgi:RNA polymerase sigma-70 factor (ECF subfamily)
MFPLRTVQSDRNSRRRPGLDLKAGRRTVLWLVATAWFAYTGRLEGLGPPEAAGDRPLLAGTPVVVSQSSAQRHAARDPDVRLMLEVRDGSAAAFEELMRRYQARLVMILEHLVGNHDLAEDLTQDVFLRVYRSRKRYLPGAKFSTWLFTIANNVASNALRSRSRRREVTLHGNDSSAAGISPLEVIIQASSGQIPARQLDKAEARDIVRLALGALNERQRLAVLLNKFEGMSYADIAETMQLSPQAIKSLLSRARINLREVLEPYFEHGESPAFRDRLQR